MIRRLEPFRPAWCEEPVAPECLDLLAEVKRSAGCPIAAGERLYTLADFYRLTALRAADVVQMDLAHCGGILAGKKIAAMAAAQDLRVAPHCSIGPVALAACLHFDVSTPNFMIQEAFAEFDVPWRNDLVGGWNPIQNGEFVLWRRAGPGPGARLSRRSPVIPTSPTPSPACGTATGRRISLRTAETEGERPCESSASRSPATSSTSPGDVAYGDAGLDLPGEPALRALAVLDRAGPAAGRRRLLVAALFARGRAGAHQGRRWADRAAPLGEAEHVRVGRGATCVVIGRSGAGYDKIDLAACTEHGVAVFNAPLALNHSTASSALLFMLALAKRLPDQERVARQGRWDRQAAVLGERDPAAARSGIVGLGHSGRELVRLVAPFAMRVLAYLAPRRPGGRPVAGRTPRLRWKRSCASRTSSACTAGSPRRPAD